MRFRSCCEELPYASTPSERRPFWEPLPLDIIYCEANPIYGVVIIDLTDVENVGCGLVAPTVYN